MLNDTAAGRALRIITLACVLGGSATAPVLAQTGGSSAAAPKVFRAKAQLKAVRGFNWFSNGQSAAQARLARASLNGLPTGRRLGNGSWICTAAGFGQKSRCVAR